MTRKFSFIAFSLILIGFIFIIPSFADNDIDIHVNPFAKILIVGASDQYGGRYEI